MKYLATKQPLLQQVKNKNCGSLPDPLTGGAYENIHEQSQLMAVKCIAKKNRSAINSEIIQCCRVNILLT
jgi:hypothetical protein